MNSSTTRYLCLRHHSVESNNWIFCGQILLNCLLFRTIPCCVWFLFTQTVVRRNSSTTSGAFSASKWVDFPLLLVNLKPMNSHLKGWHNVISLLLLENQVLHPVLLHYNTSANRESEFHCTVNWLKLPISLHNCNSPQPFFIEILLH